MACEEGTRLEKVAEIARRFRDDRAYRRALYGEAVSVSQQRDEDAARAVYEADLDVLRHKQNCEECKRGNTEDG
jgi:hypothetical protein